MNKAEGIFRTIQFANTHTQPVPTNCEGDFERAAEKMLGILNKLFPYEVEENKPSYIKDPMERANRTLSGLIGTNKTRIGPEPGEEARQAMLPSVQTALRDCKPVTLVTVWGTSRDPKNPEKNFAEMADASAFFMLKAAADRIKATHTPGAWIRIFVEDVACLWLDTENHNNPIEVGKVKAEMDKYFQTQVKLFHLLTKAVGGMPIELVQESELLRRMGYPCENMIKDCQELRPLFLQYLNESDDLIAKHLQKNGYENWTEANVHYGTREYEELWRPCSEKLMQLDSFKAVRANGWDGPITPDMREFYRAKNARLKPEIANDPVALNDAIAKYFSSTLRKATLGTAYFGLPFPDTLIRIPLVPLANGRPAQFERLVPLRSIPKDTCKGAAPECVAPWLGEGYYDNNSGYFHVGQYKGVNQNALKIPVEIVLQNDPSQLGKQSVSYPIPAKIVI